MLIEITEAGYDVSIDLRYATVNNFTGSRIYNRAACFLNPEAEELLCRAISLARALGLRFKLLDAFRPAEAQWKLWHFNPDPEFLADPRRGSPHSRGAAIDLTLIGSDGVDLDMGTEFDAFTPLSHHGVVEIQAEAQRNRLLLMGMMTAAGWDFYRNEWWHYQLFNPRRFPLLSDTVLTNGLMR